MNNSNNQQMISEIVEIISQTAITTLTNQNVNLHGFTPVVSSRLNSRVQAALAPNLLAPAARYTS